MELKKCTKCQEEKDIINFRVYNKKGKKFIQSICKKCENERNKIYTQKHKEEIAKYKKEYAIMNAEKIKEYKRIYYKENLEKIKQRKKEQYEQNKTDILAKNKIYRQKNIQRCKENHRKYYENHKDKIIARITKYKKERRKQDKIYKVKCQVRHLIGLSFARKGYIKSKKTEEILGMDLLNFYNYLLRTFRNNYGYEWDGIESVHIDHIIPLSMAKTEKEVISLCHYTNLQLLKAKDNLQKQDKTDYKIMKQEVIL